MLGGAIYRFGSTLKMGRVLGIGSWSAFRAGRYQRLFSRMRLGYHRARSNSLYGPNHEHLYDSFYKAR